MPWRVVERHIGRAGGLRQRTDRQRQWDRAYGEDAWAVGYVIDGAFVLQEDAIESIYYRSYEEHFARHPSDLATLIATAKALRNPHAEATSGVDLQVPAITAYLERHGLTLQGSEVVDIGSWQGTSSHPIGVRLSPLQIHVAGSDHVILESFWQGKKCLAVWEQDAP